MPPVIPFGENDCKRWRCLICGYIHTGDNAPYRCPICGAPQKMFEEKRIPREIR